jgi:hypothetical protein
MAHCSQCDAKVRVITPIACLYWHNTPDKTKACKHGLAGNAQKHTLCDHHVIIRDQEEVEDTVNKMMFCQALDRVVICCEGKAPAAGMTRFMYSYHQSINLSCISQKKTKVPQCGKYVDLSSGKEDHNYCAHKVANCQVHCTWCGRIPTEDEQQQAIRFLSPSEEKVQQPVQHVQHVQQPVQPTYSPVTNEMKHQFYDAGGYPVFVDHASQDVFVFGRDWTRYRPRQPLTCAPVPVRKTV